MAHNDYLIRVCAETYVYLNAPLILINPAETLSLIFNELEEDISFVQRSSTVGGKGQQSQQVGLTVVKR